MTDELPMPSEQEILLVSMDIGIVVAWCDKNNVAISALGRTALDGDQAAIYRWRASGLTGCSEPKRRKIALYILQHPTGIPGYTKGNTGKRRHKHAGSVFHPGGSTPTGSTVGTHQGGGRSTPIPVPSITALTDEDQAYIR